jgi:hypothetical protein
MHNNNIDKVRIMFVGHKLIASLVKRVTATVYMKAKIALVGGRAQVDKCGIPCNLCLYRFRVRFRLNDN